MTPSQAQKSVREQDGDAMRSEHARTPATFWQASASVRGRRAESGDGRTGGSASACLQLLGSEEAVQIDTSSIETPAALLLRSLMLIRCLGGVWVLEAARGCCSL